MEKPAVDRRKNPYLDVETLSSILTMSHDLGKSVNEVAAMMRSHIHDHAMDRQSLESIVASIRLEVGQALDGFPDSDPKAHRAYHEERLEQMHLRTEFWRKMLFELSRWGLLGFIGWAAISLWQSFLHGPK